MVYNYAELEGLWIAAGGSPSRAPLAAAIATAESSGNPSAESANPDGGTNVGTWQLDTRGKGAGYTVSELKDPFTNAQVAVKASADGTDWSAWSTYTSGRYRTYLRGGVPPTDMAQLTAAGGGVPNPLIAGLGQGLGLGSGIPGSGVAGGIFNAGHILADVASGAWWRRIGKGALGVALIGAGIYFALEKEGYHPLQTVQNVGTKAGKEVAKTAVVE